jgi:hypothetical protein
MGNSCYCCNNINFIHCNIIDSKNNISIGIYNNTNLNNISQGIQIGLNKPINNLLFVSLHKNFNMVLLNFENNIMLKVFLDKDDSNIKYKLVQGNQCIIPNNLIESHTLAKMKYIYFNNSNDFEINIIMTFIEYVKICD